MDADSDFVVCRHSSAVFRAFLLCCPVAPREFLALESAAAIWVHPNFLSAFMCGHFVGGHQDWPPLNLSSARIPYN